MKKIIKPALLGLIGIIGVGISMLGFKVPFAESLAKENWRAGLVALLLVILMIPAAIGLFIHLVDANRFKAEIVQFVRAQTQRDLVLKGDIKVTLFPKLGLDTGEMSLSQRNSAKEFASINNARFYVAWLPLLRKQLVFDRVVIDGMHANVIRLKDGSTNYDDLLIRDENLAPLTFDIDGVRITNSSINWKDDKESLRVSLQNLQLETGRLADIVPSHVTASFHLESEKASGNADVELKSRLFFDSKAGRVEFADIEGKLEGTAAGINDLVVVFKGGLDTHPAQKSLTAENVSATLSGKYGPRNIEARLSVPKVLLGKGVWSGSQFSIDTTLTQPGETLTATLQVPAFEIADRILKVAESSTAFDFRSESNSFQGKLASPLSINFAAAPKLQLDNVVLSFAARHPVLSRELGVNVTGNAQADIGAQNASVSFSAKADDAEIAGAIALSDFSRPAWNFELNANRLDLDRYISPDWLMRFQDDAAPFDFTAMKALNLNGKLRAGEFKLAKFKAGKLAADVRVEQATLTIAPLAANVYGGALTGSVSVAAQGRPQIALKQSLKGFQMDMLLADTASAGKISGKGDLVMDLSAEGDTTAALRKSLNGSVSLALARGSLAGIDLRAALIEGKNELGNPGGAKMYTANFSDKTGFSDLKAVFNFKDGNSSANSFEMKSPQLRAVGEGDFTPDSGSISYRLNATVASAVNRRTAGELAELKGVTVPIRVSGPYATPTIALDFAAASGDIVARRIAAKAVAEEAAAKAAAKAAADKAAAEQAAILAAARAAAPRAAASTAKRAARPVKK